MFGEAILLDSLNEKWFLNVNNVDIPIEVQYQLQLGEGFGLPINKHNIDRTLIEFIKNIKNNIIGRRNNIINFVRNNTILEKFQNEFPRRSSNNKLLFKNYLTKKYLTIKFVKDHSEILISKANERNITVAQNKLLGIQLCFRRFPIDDFSGK